MGMMDLHITHERWGSNVDPDLNGHLHYQNDIDGPLNETVTDKIRQYHTDYNNRPSNTISFIPAIASTSGRLHWEFVHLLFLQTRRETDCFFGASGVQFAQSNTMYHYRRVAFSSQIKSKVGHILAKAAVLRINLNIDVVPIVSRSHTHPSNSQTSLLLTSSLSSGVPVPHATQC